MSASEHAKCEGRCCQNVHETSMRVIQIRVSQWKRFLCTARLRQRIATLFCFFFFFALTFICVQRNKLLRLPEVPTARIYGSTKTAVLRERKAARSAVRHLQILKRKKKERKTHLRCNFRTSSSVFALFRHVTKEGPRIAEKKKLTSR